MRKRFDIYDRAFNFAVRVAKIIDRLPSSIITKEYCRQLIRSSGSIGANLEEADGALSKKVFINKIGIARKESKESKHWLNLIQSTALITNENDTKELLSFIKECTEILLILSSIINKTKENKAVNSL
jgi:four helix bundle protein